MQAFGLNPTSVIVNTETLMCTAVPKNRRVGYSVSLELDQELNSCQAEI